MQLVGRDDKDATRLRVWDIYHFQIAADVRLTQRDTCPIKTLAVLPRMLQNVHDFVLDGSRARPPYAAIFGVNMLVMSDRGRTYSRGEIEALLSRAGFGEARHHDLGERRGISVVTARAP